MMHPYLQKQLTAGDVAAEFLTADVRSTAEHLADLMRAMHGGDWRVEIEHKAGFVLIAPRLERDER